MSFRFELILNNNENNKKLINKFNLLVDFLNKNNIKVKSNIINYYDLTEETKIQYADVLYLPSWFLQKEADILVISGDHLIKALKNNLINFYQGKL